MAKHSSASYSLDFMSSSDNDDDDDHHDDRYHATVPTPQKLACGTINAAECGSFENEPNPDFTTRSDDDNDRCKGPQQFKRKSTEQTGSKKIQRKDNKNCQDKTTTTTTTTKHRRRPANESAFVAKRKINNNTSHSKRPDVVCTTADEMVRAACLNIHNSDSIDMMEWSEAVMLCLASPTAYDELDRLSWSAVQTICHDNEWSVKIASAIKQHMSRGDTLNTLLSRNRREKVQKKYLTADQTDMFSAVPQVNMKLLKSYVPVIQVHARTKFNKALLHKRY